MLGAVLLIAIGITFLATVQIEYKPRWDEDRESRHFDGVLTQFSDLKAETEKQAVNRSLAPVASPMNLVPPKGSGFFGETLATGSLAFRASTITTTSFAPTLTVIEKNGRTLGLLNEQWVSSGGSSVVEGIDRIDSLRLRFTGPNVDKLEFKKNAYAELEVTDADGNFAGSFRTYIPDKDKHDMWVKVVTATGEILIDQEYAPDLKYKEHNKFWVDALDPSWPFHQLLQATKAPYSFELTYDFPELDPNKWPAVEYSVAYIKQTQSGDEVYVGGGGSASIITNYQNVRTGGRLSYNIEYQQYPTSEIVLENGALIVSQAEGASMVLEPHFQIERSGTETLLNIVSPIYKGSSDDLGGRKSASIVTAGRTSDQIFGLTPEFRYTIETDYPDIWVDFLDNQFKGAGMTSPDQYIIVKLPGAVQVNVYGTSNSATVNDVQIRINYNIIDVSMG